MWNLGITTCGNTKARRRCKWVTAKLRGTLRKEVTLASVPMYVGWLRKWGQISHFKFHLNICMQWNRFLKVCCKVDRQPYCQHRGRHILLRREKRTTDTYTLISSWRYVKLHSKIRPTHKSSHFKLHIFICILAQFSMFWKKIKVGLWDNHAVYVFVYPP
jgi:hypothetical protein